MSQIKRAMDERRAFWTLRSAGLARDGRGLVLAELLPDIAGAMAFARILAGRQPPFQVVADDLKRLATNPRSRAGLTVICPERSLGWLRDACRIVHVAPAPCLAGSSAGQMPPDSAFLAPPAPGVVYLQIGAPLRPGVQSRHLTAPMSGAALDHLALGKLSAPEPLPGDLSGDQARWAVNWQLPAAVEGSAAVPLILTGLRHLLDLYVGGEGVRSPMVIHLDMAALGFGWDEGRRLEADIDRILDEWATHHGLTAMLLSDRGIRPELSTATVALDPGAACKLDLFLPQGRRHPTFLDIRQHGGGVAPVRIELRGAEVPEAVVAAGHGESEAHVEGLGPAELAHIWLGSAARDAARTHLVAIAPTMRVAPGVMPADPGAWEVTIHNLGSLQIELSLVLETAHPLTSPARQPQPRLMRSNSQIWDPDVDGSTELDFYGASTRLETLARGAAPVPSRVVRMTGEAQDWPTAMLAYGIRQARMELRTPEPAVTGAAPAEWSTRSGADAGGVVALLSAALCAADSSEDVPRRLEEALRRLG